MNLFFLLYVQTAGWSGSMSHLRLSMGRLAWNDLTAAWTPVSPLIFLEISRADETAWAVRQNEIASISLSAVSDLWGIGFGPAPAAATMFPQNGWLQEVY